MAETTLNIRLKQKYDTFQNWTTANPVLLTGETVYVVIPAGAGAVAAEPIVLSKTGNGTDRFADLPWNGGIAADVYAWAKMENKPSYTAAEIGGLTDFISGAVQDTDTQYKIEADAADGHKFYLKSKAKGETAWKTQDTIIIPDEDTKYTLAEGAANGTVKFNGTDVPVHGLGSAAYANTTAFDISGAAAAVKTEVIGTSGDASGVNSIYGAKKYADERAAAVVYDDTALKARVSTNEAAISTLNGTGAGSVSKQVADAVSAIVSDAPEAYDTLKEIADWISGHAGDAAAMNSAISTNSSDIAALEALVGALPAGAASDTIVAYIAEAAQAAAAGKVDKVAGKGLSAEDFTSALKTKLNAIAAGAQVNVLEAVKVNGIAQAITSKAVDITVPTGALADKDTVSESDLASALSTKLNAKANTADLAAVAKSGKASDLTQDVGDYIIFNCGSATVNI